MNYAINLAIGFFITMPILTFLHEMGHAAPQLSNKEHVRIQIGNAKYSITFKLGLLSISIAPFPTHIGFCSINPTRNYKKRVLIFLAGPMVSFVLAILFYILIAQDHGYWTNFQIRFALYASIIQTILALFPIQYPDFMGSLVSKSDGLQILELLRSKGN